jgi:hypothetical protein
MQRKIMIASVASNTDLDKEKIVIYVLLDTFYNLDRSEISLEKK